MSYKYLTLLSIPCIVIGCFFGFYRYLEHQTPRHTIQSYPYLSGDTIYIQSGISYHIEKAITPVQHQIGLMNRPSLAVSDGMLFVFDTMGIYPFWMKNTLIPLDILWLDDNLRIVDTASMTPCTMPDCPIYTPNGPARYALEISAGQLKRLGL